MNRSDIGKAWYYLKKNGIKNTFYASCERLMAENRMQYCYMPVMEEEKRLQKETVFSNPVRFSIVVPMYETNEVYAREMITSVINQTYPHFELILADASPSDALDSLAASFHDKRIRYIKIEENHGISANTNVALQEASGDYTGLLDHDDLLTEDALFCMAQAICRAEEEGNTYSFLYSDEDKCDKEARTFYEANCKPDFNLDLLLSNNYICHFLVMKTELIKRLLLRKEFDGAQDYDLVLRACESIKKDSEICHISHVLYHWRCHENSTASNPSSKTYAYEAGRRAIMDYLQRNQIHAKVENTRHNGFYRVNYGEEKNSRERKASAVFEKRGDIGAIAGNLYSGNKIIGGLLNTDGTCTYYGLNRHFSGYIHRAVLQQDCETADIRNMMVREELYPLWEKYVPANFTSLNQEELNTCSRKLCGEIKKRGYRILWDPFF